MCEVGEFERKAGVYPPRSTLVRGVRLGLGLSRLGNTGESLNHRAVFLKGMRGVLESLLRSVLNAIRAPNPIEHFLRSQTLEWK